MATCVNLHFWRPSSALYLCIFYLDRLFGAQACGNGAEQRCPNIIIFLNYARFADCGKGCGRELHDSGMLSLADGRPKEGMALRIPRLFDVVADSSRNFEKTTGLGN